MPAPFDVYEYLGYLRSRWLFLLTACGVAFAIALGISLLLPKQYTATATMMIDPPAAGDPRAATAVSPVYLESLRTYERLAQSDTLFAEAIEKLHLRDDNPKAAVDGLRLRSLKVTKPRDTRVLEVNATWRDPARAQALAQYIAERTIAMNREMAIGSDNDAIGEARRRVEAGKARLAAAEKNYAAENGSKPYESLQAEAENLADLEARVKRELLEARVDVADYAAQGKQRESAAVKARVDLLEKQLADVASELTAKQSAAAERRAQLDGLESVVRIARTELEAAERRLRDLEASVGSRSERLRMIDPGIVPQRPSSPNVMLNVLVAVFLALVATWVYLTATFQLRARERRPVRAYSSER